MQKMWKGRWKKKCFRNKMDDMEKCYNNDMYGSGEFDKLKNKIQCIVCHCEGHTINRHKQGLKRNPRVRGTADRNCRSGATTIIKVMPTNNIEKVFYLLVCTNIIRCIYN
jgi:hypothetical protein